LSQQGNPPPDNEEKYAKLRPTGCWKLATENNFWCNINQMNQSQLEQISKRLNLGQVRYEDTVTSTNDLAAVWSAEGAPHFSLIAANHQTHGRGRGGRKWFTPPDSALAFSLLLRPEHPHEDMGRFSGLGALAVCTALKENYKLKSRIKWPNDVLLNGRKVCGILPEAIWFGEKLRAVILGIGINLKLGAYPKDVPLLFPAIAVEEALSQAPNDAQFLYMVLTHLKSWYAKLETPAFIAEWQANLAFRGQSVEIIQGDQPTAVGQLTGLDDQGHLVIKNDQGEMEAFSASEIHLRPVDDTSSK
jgi:BirA family biotin operon repressor/biotin-[acetyl-CoA-carboxylase] ligase